MTIFYGTTFADKITGTDGKDTIFGLGGFDILRGAGGDDTIHAHRGTQYGGGSFLYGGAGNDLLISDNAAGTLYGNEGNDTLVANGTDVRLVGGLGNDVLSLNLGFSLYRPALTSTYVYGGDGDDTITLNFEGRLQDMVVRGGAGTDCLITLGYHRTLAGMKISGIEWITVEDRAFPLNTGMGITVAQTNAVHTLEGSFHLSGGGTVNLVGKQLLDFVMFCSNAGNIIQMDAAITTACSVRTGAGLDEVFLGSGDDYLGLQEGETTAGQVFDGGAGQDTISLQVGVDATGMSITNFEKIRGNLRNGTNGPIVLHDQLAQASTLEGVFKLADAGTLDLNGKVLTGFTMVLSDLGNTVQAEGVADRMIIIGGAQDDVLTAGTGGDTLTGGGGADIIDGGHGRDTMTGGAGPDHFVFEYGDSTGNAKADKITDFTQSDGDIIDLSAIDADTTTPGNQAFSFIGTSSFLVAGQLRFANMGGTTVIEADRNFDGLSDFSLILTGDVTLVSGDFIL